MSMVKLIATDLDGTLLDSAGKISERNRAALLAAMERGVHVTLCTGRMFSSAKRFSAQLGITIPLICYNGAMVRRQDGEMLSHLPLEMGLARGLLAIFKERDIYVQSYVDDVLYVRDADEEEFRMYVRHFGITGRAIGNDLYAPPQPPTKLLAIGDSDSKAESLMRDLRETFGDKVYVTRSNADFVEMMDPRAGKGLALAGLAESLGIPMDSVLAIGDGENDTGMIKNAGFGIAVANGLEQPRAAAREVAPSNDEDGVAWAVEKFVLNG